MLQVNLIAIAGALYILIQSLLMIGHKEIPSLKCVNDRAVDQKLLSGFNGLLAHLVFVKQLHSPFLTLLELQHMLIHNTLFRLLNDARSFCLGIEKCFIANL